MSRQNERDRVRAIMATTGVKYTHARRLAAQERITTPSDLTVGGPGHSKTLGLLDPLRFVGTTDHDHEPVYYTPPMFSPTSILAALPGTASTDLWPQGQDVAQVVASDRDGFRYEGLTGEHENHSVWAKNDHVIVFGPTACGKSCFLSHVVRTAESDDRFGTPLVIDVKDSVALGYDQWAKLVITELSRVTDSMTYQRSCHVSAGDSSRTLVVVDEAGLIFVDPDPDYRDMDRIREMVSSLLLTGGEYGIQVVMAHQRPLQLESLFGTRVSFPIPASDFHRGQVAVLSTGPTTHQLIKVPFG